MGSSAVPVLYMFPPSFYSQRARLALRVKKIKHKETFINIAQGDQNMPSYLKMNPNGEVPMLKVNDQVFNDSEKIVEVVDQLPSDCEVKLLPSESSPEGQEVTAWRAKLNAVDCGNLTYGVMLNPELSIDGVQVLAAFRSTKEGIKIRFANTIKKLEKIQEQHPELRQACQRKIQLSQERTVSFCDKSNCMKLMDGLGNLMDDVEKKLQSVQAGQYLCGPNFTAADISLCVLLGRLNFLGILSRYVGPNKRPELCAYWNRVKQHPDVHSIVLSNMAEVKMILMKKKLKQITLVTAGVALISVGIWAAFKHLSGSSSN